MAIIYQPLEIRRVDGTASGKYRMVRYSDEDESVPRMGLCEHEHDTTAEASACPDAREVVDASMMPGASAALESLPDGSEESLLTGTPDTLTRALREAETHGREEENKACTERLREYLDTSILKWRSAPPHSGNRPHKEQAIATLQAVRVAMLAEELE